MAIEIEIDKQNSTARVKKIFVFGNIDLPNDSLPILILPELEEMFPNIHFEIKDPNEEWIVSDDITVIDTVVGIKDITVFESLEKFTSAPRVGAHDFDALTNLRLLQKLGKIKDVRIIGVPSDMEEPEVIRKVSELIK